MFCGFVMRFNGELRCRLRGKKAPIYLLFN